MRKWVVTSGLVVALSLIPAIAEGEAGGSEGGSNPVVVMKTSKGAVEIELYPGKAPVTVENFLKYVDDGFYDGTVFHRVISNFMIQGGGMTPDLAKKETRGAIENEATNGLANEVGTIAMARLPAPDSATAQFFINTKDNAFLNHVPDNPRQYGYAVFGKVVSGMDVVRSIEGVATGNRRAPGGMTMGDVPTEAVLIESIARK